MDKDRDIIIAVVTASVLFLLFAVFTVSYFLIFRRKNKQHRTELDLSQQNFKEQLQQSRTEVQETTYSILAKELHDNVGQLLSTSKMLLGITEREMPHPPETLLTANETLGKAIHELRTLSKSLDNDWLEQFSFSENIDAELKRLNASGKISASFFSDAAVPLPAEKQIILFRIAQEAIQNAVKHAQPERMSVSVKNNDHRETEIMIQDNGCGMKEETGGAGMGLANMRHRAEIIGGKISWSAAAGGGTAVVITLPENIT